MNDCYHSVFKSQKRIESGRGYSSISLLSLCGSQGTRVRPRGPGAAGTSSRRDIYRTGSCPLFELKYVSLRTYLPRKEVIQPHLPVRLPCYDFVPIASPTFTRSPSKRDRPQASSVTNFRDVTGGVYKARERIHRSVADLRLLATPPSRGRVADPDPNQDAL